MPGITCAIRGGPDSQPTIQKAISLAQENSLPLYFLYIVNLDFLVHTQMGRVHTITDQLDQMGEFILLTAQSKAQKKGVEAEGVIRHGNVREEIVEFAKEVKADYVVLGLPTGDDESEQNEFAADRIREFGEIIEQESGANAIFVERDSTE